MCEIIKIIIKNNKILRNILWTGISVTSFSRLLLINNSLKPVSIGGNRMCLYELTEEKTEDSILKAVNDYGWNKRKVDR